ncbi:MAG: guanylate kinase [Elusimicrobiota bacterium]|jgi:guanylate kinase|nr:guanylate kinase [Elusimicrobiota bacterium]
MKKNKKIGKIIVISAPSGAGKTTICNEIIKSDKNTIYSISYTTRKPRGNEKNGVEYFFTDIANFKKMLKADKFVEWAKVHDNYYATPKSFLSKTIKSGINILLDVDVQGGMKIKKHFPQACLIFIKVPSIKALRERLIKRGQDNSEIIKMRIKNAKKEMQFINKYDYVVVNDDLEESISAVKAIIKSLDYKITSKGAL